MMLQRWHSAVYQAPETPVAPAPAAPAAPAASPAAAEPPAAAAPQAPAGPLAAFWDAEKNTLDLDKLGTAFTERDAAFTAQAERAKTIPATAAEYKFELPQDFALPEGAKVTFDEQAPVVGPLLAEMRAAAHEMGIPQQGLSKLLALQTKFQIESEKHFQAQEVETRKAENAKLGEGADARRTAIKSAWSAAGLSEPEIAELGLSLSRAAGVTAYEKLIAGMNGTRMPNNHRENPPPPAAEPSIESRWYPSQTQQKAS